MLKDDSAHLTSQIAQKTKREKAPPPFVVPVTRDDIIDDHFIKVDQNDEKLIIDHHRFSPKSDHDPLETTSAPPLFSRRVASDHFLINPREQKKVGKVQSNYEPRGHRSSASRTSLAARRASIM